LTFVLLLCAVGVAVAESREIEPDPSSHITQQEIVPANEVAARLNSLPDGTTVLAVLPAVYARVRTCTTTDSGAQTCRVVQILEQVLIVKQAVVAPGG
jgi:hypothetical protein